jgi:Fe2+ transport system protein FeoA
MAVVAENVDLQLIRTHGKAPDGTPNPACSLLRAASESSRSPPPQIAKKSFLQLSLNLPSLLPLNKPGLTCSVDAGCNADPYLCPLSRVVAGTAVRIKRLAAPPEIINRLRELGLGEEQQIKLLRSHPDLICLVCNARLGISAQLGDAILVQPLPG